MDAIGSREGTGSQATVMPRKDTTCPLCGNRIVWTPELESDASSGDFKCPRCNRRMNPGQRRQSM